MSRRSDSVTIRSVAREAGVSVATVSRVMSGSEKVTPARRTHVLAVAQRMGYRPNVMARGLARGTSAMVGVVVPNLSNPYFYDVLRGIGRASAADGYRMVVSDSMEDAAAERDLATELLRYVDALILLGPREDGAHLDALRTGPKPVVMLLGPRPATTLPDLSVDAYAGMLDLYRHLADLGHRRVVYLAGPAGAWQNARRVEAGRAAAALGVQVEVVAAGGTIQAGYESTDAALAGRPTAVTCFNDLVALGVLHRLAERGVRVPDELSVAGFDDIDVAGYVSPGLTTVRTPREELGRSGWAALHRMILGAPAEEGQMLPAELVVRASTAPPAARNG